MRVIATAYGNVCTNENQLLVPGFQFENVLLVFFTADYRYCFLRTRLWQTLGFVMANKASLKRRSCFMIVDN